MNQVSKSLSLKHQENTSHPPHMKHTATFKGGLHASGQQTRTGRWIKFLGLLVLVLVFNGCASRIVPGGADRWSYNAYTGYPPFGYSESPHR